MARDFSFDVALGLGARFLNPSFRTVRFNYRKNAFRLRDSEFASVDRFLQLRNSGAFASDPELGKPTLLPE